MATTEYRTWVPEDPGRALKEAHEHLVRIEKLASIGQLAGMVAHDLRNPLAAIKNAAYYLRKRLVSSEMAQFDPRIDQFLGIIDEEVEHSNQIITDLMDFARVNPPFLFPTRLQEVVERSLNRLELRPSVTTVCRSDPGVPELMADAEQLERVFMNLALNAQEAIPFGGELTISTRTDGDCAEVQFSDTGVGIAEEDKDKLFEPLFTTKSRGTGLGLAVCLEIVTKHGGAIDVESEQGEGSTFIVRLTLNGNGA